MQFPDALSAMMADVKQSVQERKKEFHLIFCVFLPFLL